jgi:hypothetical protein
MINEQAIDTMTQMMTLITKYAKGAYPEVETEASSENRRRAWAVTCMLARVAEHAAESDMYFLLAEDPRKTDAEREHCYRVARQEDIGFMRQLNEFRKCAEEFKNEPVTGKIRTDNDIVRELERLLQNGRALQKMHEGFAENGAAKVTKKERELRAASRTVITENLASVKQQIEATEKLARARGMVVSLGRHRTIIKQVAKPAPAPGAMSAAPATKAKKGTVLTLVETKSASKTSTKPSPAKKSA